jgi:uridine monophosphate synthetase
MIEMNSPGFIAEFLFDSKAIKIDTQKGYKLKLHETNPDAPLSPIYLNLRTPENSKPGPLDEKSVGVVAVLLWRYAQKHGLTFSAIAGLPNAGTPFAEAFKVVAGWDHVNLPNIKLGKTEVDGIRKIEGVLDRDGAKPGDTVLVIDDLITRGDSKREGIEALRKDGFVVNDVLVLVDREQGGENDLRQLGVDLYSLTTLESILANLYQLGKITEEQLDKIRKYLDTGKSYIPHGRI